jgi:hypothetical protein
MFEIDQQVVCVSGCTYAWWSHPFTGCLVSPAPIDGIVYTIRDIVPSSLRNDLGLHFYELPSPAIGCGFSSDFFRSVRKTNIEQLREIAKKASRPLGIPVTVGSDDNSWGHILVLGQ